MAVLERGRTWLDPVMGPVERLLYRLFGINPSRDHSWKQYAIAMLMFSAVGFVLTYGILRLQNHLPLQGSPDALQTPMTPDLAFNSAASFTTNTNWQSYGGEDTMTYFSQMVGLTFHNFASTAVGIAIAAALVRGATEQELVRRLCPDTAGGANRHRRRNAATSRGYLDSRQPARRDGVHRALPGLPQRWRLRAPAYLIRE